jgi:pimeloyl-ACP methyl ester carboxylesterase
VAFVLVHGGGFTASCWDPLIPFLKDTVRAVDLPGRGGRPADLKQVTIADSVDAVVEEIVAIDQRVVLVGHSMAGITLPAVVGRVPERIGKVVFVSCVVPADGECLYEALDPAMKDVADEAQSSDQPDTGKLDGDVAVKVFCNDMNDEQTEFTLGRMVPESIQLMREPVSLSGLRHQIPRVYIRLSLDAIVAPSHQDRMIANMGGAETFDLDAGHMAMISRPRELAAILNSL